MAWRGAAEFWDFSEGTRGGDQAGVVPPTEEAFVLGEGWRGLSGTWELQEHGGNAVLAGAAEQGTAVSLNGRTRAAKGVYGATVVPQGNCKSASLLFQVSDDLQQGFECRLGDRVLLRSLDGRDLWEQGGFAWKAGEAYRLEGIVVTDRVSLRVLDAAGAVLLESEECYVSDTNNTRQGGLGFKLEGGAARFSEWEVLSQD
jgi:hypothetical protein